MIKKLRRISLLVFALLLVSIWQLSVKAADIKQADVRDGDTYIGREFNADFDLMFDDFERSALGAVSEAKLWWANNFETDVDLTSRISYLQADYSTEHGTTYDAPIYKVASPSNTEGAYNYLVFEMSGTNNASIDDLILSFRFNDNYLDLEVNFADLLGPDLTPMPEVTEEYQIYIISLADSLDGKVYQKIAGREGPETIEAGNSLSGFHFISKNEGEGSGTLRIKTVYYSNDSTTLGYSDSDDNFLLDNFNRTDLHATDENVWWRGGGPASQIIGKWLEFDYQNQKGMFREAGYDNSNAPGNYENFVLRIKGRSGGEDLLIQPFYVVEGEDVLGEAIALSELKGPDGLVVPALTKDFQNLVINFAENGWEKNVNGFHFESKDGETGLIYIDDIFFTNMEYDASEILTVYPIIGADDLVVFDNFNRSELGATPDYDSNNQVALDNNLLYIIAYAGMERLSIVDGALVFDCTENEDYIQYTSAGNNVNDGSYQYMILKVKGEDGATMQNFRMQTINAEDKRSSIVWGNGGLKSGSGLPIADFDTENYPYVTEDGYMYVIIDLVASNLSETVIGFDLFYSGSGKLFVDSIFFANSTDPNIDLDNKIVFDDFNRSEFESENYWYYITENASLEDDTVVLDATGNKHSYIKFASPNNNSEALKKYLVLKMKGEEGTTLESFRINMINEDGDSPISFYNAGQLVSFPGVSIPQVSTEYQYFIIDLEASGLPVNAQGIVVTFGDWDEGKLIIDEIFFADSVDQLELIEDALEKIDNPDDENPIDENPVDENPDDKETKEKDEGLSTEAIIGIIAGVIIVITGAVYVILRKRV